MQYTTKQLFDILYEKVNNIYETFKDFFGEDKVDLQYDRTEEGIIHDIQVYLLSYKVAKTQDDKYDIEDDMLEKVKEHIKDYQCYIYVWWPFVTVTNEHNKSIGIKDLYARIIIQADGRIPYEQTGFTLNRATYTEIQFLSNYMHSHIKEIPKYDFKVFMSPCLGTGPIGNTINTLKVTYDKITWMLFCQELSMYVTVESLTGGPWRRLESIGAKRQSINYSGYSFYNASFTNIHDFTNIISSSDLKEFIKYYLQHGHLVISYRNNRYTYGMPYYNFIIDISNAFIAFFNKELSKRDIEASTFFTDGLLTKQIVSNGKFYVKGDGSTYDNIEAYQDKYVLTFKGKEIRTTITKNASQEEGYPVILLNNNIAMCILYTILNTINYRYNYVYNKRNQATTTSSSTIYF